LKVLELGEEVLARSPRDVDAHLSMAKAAEALGLPRLALWLTEQAVAQVPRSAPALRALAHLHERQGRFSHALKAWAQVCQEIPDDPEAQRKMNDLAAQETIQRGNYRSRASRSGRRGRPSSDG
jgi:tetratricopeptide (TPR) repeat protein